MMEAGVYKIEKLAQGGLGVARDGPMTMLVRRVIPGEEVRLKLLEKKQGGASAEATEIVRPSPDRVAPRCPRFGPCGGCDLQHVAYPRQLELKREIAVETLWRVGGLEVSPSATLAAARPYGYRSRLKLQVKSGRVGFFGAGSHDFLPAPSCDLARDELNRAIPLLGPLIRHRTQTIELILEDSGVVVALVDGKAALVFELAPGPKPNWRPAPERAIGFAQVNPDQNLALRELVAGLARAHPAELGLELFAGSGNLTAALLEGSRRVVAVDSDPAAEAGFNRSVKPEHGERVEFKRGRAETYLTAAATRGLAPGLILLDPPRTGARACVPLLLALHPNTIIHVSCDPATLARDLKPLLAAGYRLLSLHLIDMFPQTAHLELVALLDREDIKAQPL